MIALGLQLCDVIINGGTTAAVASALAAARSVGSPADLTAVESAKNPRPGSRPQVCLLEPTDWIGGQLTAAAVSALDFPWHKFQKEMRSFHNLNSVFFDMIKTGAVANVIEGLNPGRCWVSAYCNTPKHFVTEIQKLLDATPNLRVFRNTVVKSVTVSGNRIIKIEAIQRTPRTGNGWTQALSEMWNDWYSQRDSSTFRKNVVTFELQDTYKGAFIEASDTGDVFALTDAKYVQGVELIANDLNSNNDQCGQAFVFPFVQTKSSGVAEIDLPIPPRSAQFYGFGKTTPERLFSYRQISADRSAPQTLQNWNPGNDFPFEYMFISRAETQFQAQDWRGGVSVSALKMAEDHALGWHQFFKKNASFGKELRLDKAAIGNTSNGLAKVPYLRDVRRSVGLGGFFIRNQDIWPQDGFNLGKQFPDSLGVGLYAADVHSNKKCSAPAYLNSRTTDVAPFTLPFLAHTNASFANLLVAGKSMAQTYYVNAATRVQPVEWSSGWGAGVAAAHLWRNRATTLEVGLAFLAEPVAFRNTHESDVAFQQRLAKSKKLLKDIQFEITDTQPLWFCNALGRNNSCVTPSGKFRLFP